jgi:hypothetical protein
VFKKISFALLLYIAGHVGYDAFMNYQSTTGVERNMPRLVSEMNQKLPWTDDVLGIELSYTYVGLRHINDRLRMENYSIAVGPESCG